MNSVDENGRPEMADDEPPYGAFVEERDGSDLQGAPYGQARAELEARRRADEEDARLLRKRSDDDPELLERYAARAADEDMAGGRNTITRFADADMATPEEGAS